MAETDHVFDHVVGALRADLVAALELPDDSVVVGWPKVDDEVLVGEEAKPRPQPTPLPLVSVSLVSATVEIHAPRRMASAPIVGTANTVATYKVGSGRADVNVDLWTNDRTERLALGGKLRTRLFGSPETGLSGLSLVLARLGERARYLATDGATYDDDDGAGPRMIVPVSVRVPYLVRRTLPRVRTLYLHSGPLPGGWPGLGDEVVVVFEEA